MGDGGSEVGAVGGEPGNKLLTDGHLLQVSVLVPGGDVDVQGSAAAAVDLCCKRRPTQVDVGALALVDVDDRDAVDDLDLAFVALGELDAGDGLVDDQAHLVADVDADGVDLALDLNHDAVAVADVDALVHGAVDCDEAIVDVGLGDVGDHPLVVHQLVLRRLLGGGRGLGVLVVSDAQVSGLFRR